MVEFLFLLGSKHEKYISTQNKKIIETFYVLNAFKLILITSFFTFLFSRKLNKLQVFPFKRKDFAPGCTLLSTNNKRTHAIEGKNKK